MALVCAKFGKKLVFDRKPNVPSLKSSCALSKYFQCKFQMRKYILQSTPLLDLRSCCRNANVDAVPMDTTCVNKHCIRNSHRKQWIYVPPDVGNNVAYGEIAKGPCCHFKPSLLLCFPFWDSDRIDRNYTAWELRNGESTQGKTPDPSIKPA